jgi:ABC-type iron transport system FetAB permease component
MGRFLLIPFVLGPEQKLFHIFSTSYAWWTILAVGLILLVSSYTHASMLLLGTRRYHFRDSFIHLPVGYRIDKKQLLRIEQGLYGLYYIKPILMGILALLELF